MEIPTWSSGAVGRRRETQTPRRRTERACSHCGSTQLRGLAATRCRLSARVQQRSLGWTEGEARGKAACAVAVAVTPREQRRRRRAAEGRPQSSQSNLGGAHQPGPAGPATSSRSAAGVGGQILIRRTFFHVLCSDGFGVCGRFALVVYMLFGLYLLKLKLVLISVSLV